jgi:multidrug efflux pump subunit AcrA (membrane-fusion protein)
VEAHPEKVYQSRVDLVDALAKRRYWNVPVQYFEAVIIPNGTDPETMKPGQRVRAEIILEELPDVLTVPLQAIFKEDDQKKVYLEKDSQFVPVEVTLGPRSLSQVQVLEGLKENDIVALRDPGRDPAEILEQSPDQDAAPAPPGGSP